MLVSTVEVSRVTAMLAAPLVALFKLNVRPSMISFIVFVGRLNVTPLTVSAALAAVAPDGVSEASILFTEGVTVN